MNKIWKYFNENELKCHCGKCSSDGSEMNHPFMHAVNYMREVLDFPFIVTSPYRCPEYNDKISKSGKNGPHTTGCAMDVAVYGENAYNFIEAALYCEMTGIGIKQNGDYSKRFIHIDVCDSVDNSTIVRPRIWSY